MKEIFCLLMLIVVTTISISLIVRRKSFSNLKNRREIKILNFFLVIALGIFIALYFCESVKQIKRNYNEIIAKNNSRIFWNLSDEKMNKENNFYFEIIESNSVGLSYTKPYIPDGFTHILGEWDDGYVIKDSIGNEYVWIPCTNDENGEVPMISKKDFISNPTTSFYTCFDDNYEDFLRSVMKYGGFYLSRYEISSENNEYYSMANKSIVTDMSNNQVKEIINYFETNMIDDNCQIEMVNGYAYDIALDWMKSNNQGIINDKYDIHNEKTFLSGKKAVSNIFDFLDNVLEMTSEYCYDTQVIRGVPYNDEIEKRNYNMFSEESRYTLYTGESHFSEYDLVAFRTIMIRR